jgi:hypothetical protein
MYRTAQHVKDYTGGQTRWAKDLAGLVAGVNNLLAAQVIQARAGVPAGNLIFVGVAA